MYNANRADEKEKRKIETEGKSGQEKELMMNETRLHAEIREIIYSQIFHCVNDVRARSLTSAGDITIQPGLRIRPVIDGIRIRPSRSRPIRKQYA